MKKRRDSVDAQTAANAGNEQLFRYAEDLRAIIESHEKLKADYQHLKGRQAELDQGDDAFRQLLSNNRNLYMASDDFGRITHANPAAAAFFNLTNLRGKNVLDVLPRHIVAAGKALRPEINPQALDNPLALINAQGEECLFTLRVIRGSEEQMDKSMLHWMLFPADDNSETDLSWMLATTVFNGAGEGIVVADESGLILTANPAFCAMLDVEARALTGRGLDDLIEWPVDTPTFADIVEAGSGSDQWQGKILIHSPKGDSSSVWMALSISRHSNGAINSCIALLSNMAPILTIERHLSYAANYDSLTNLPNRNLLMNRLENALTLAKRRHEPVTVLFMDLDGFKGANDRHGHDFGDFVLQEVARRLSALIRESDTLGRYGGDEFVMILHGMEREPDIKVFGGKLLDAMRRDFTFQGKSSKIGLSVGAALYPSHAQGPAKLLQMADSAMYMAKAAGGHCLRVFSAYAQGQSEQSRRSCSIADALDRRDLHLVYQPQFDIRQDPPRVVGVEALLRCRVPESRTTPTPDAVLQIAERDHMLGILNRWVLETACQQFAEWQAQGADDLMLSINFEPGQLREQRFLEMVYQVLSSLQLPSSSVWFDSPLDFNLASIDSLAFLEGGREKLSLLRRLGVSLTMEDTARQHFSLNDLSGLPISRLKISPQTVAALGASDRALVQCQAVAALGQAFGLEVGAVGIENRDQLRLLQHIGFHFGQGFYLGMPLAAEQFWPWYAAQRAAN